MYYEELEKLYGKANYYSMDPFHEGGNTEGVDLAKTGASIMAAMKKANPEAVWIIQAWQANPREEMIASLNQGDLLVLDLEILSRNKDFSFLCFLMKMSEKNVRLFVYQGLFKHTVFDEHVAKFAVTDTNQCDGVSFL